MRDMVSFSTFVTQIVHQTIFIFLLVGAAFALIAGVMLLLDSGRALRIGDRLNRWVSTRAAIRPLEEHRSISKPLYRMHRLVGVLICAGALYSLLVLGTPHGGAAIINSLAGLGPARFSAWISESLRAILLTEMPRPCCSGSCSSSGPVPCAAWRRADRRISARKSTKPLEEAILRSISSYTPTRGSLVDWWSWAACTC